MHLPLTHILPLTTIRRERLLPVPGRVLVRKGQKVNPDDVIAESNLALEHLILDVARGLGQPPSVADRYLQRKAGEEVSEGDVIAGPVGFMRRVVRAPRSGRVIVAGEGQVLMEVESPPLAVRAGFPGVVAELVPERGGVIENTGALIQGVWGNGRVDYGLMHVLIRKPEDILTSDQLDVSLRGSVVLGGYCGEAELLKNAAELPVRGLILSSMASSLVQLAAKMRFPIVILEGFGFLPMNSVAYKLLTTNDRREIALNADPLDRYADQRPELVIPLPATGHTPLPRETTALSPDQRVRIVRSPYMSGVGTVLGLRHGSEVFPSGIRAPAAEILLEIGEKVVLPLVNLDVLE